MRIVLSVAGLLVVASIIFITFINFGMPHHGGPTSVEIAITQTQQALGGLFTLFAGILLLCQATGTPKVTQMLSLMIAVLAGIILTQPNWVPLVIFATLGLAYAGYELANQRLVKSSSTMPQATEVKP